MYVDNAAMQLTLKPSQFDVMLTTNMFGDILSDAAAALVGSIGLIPSASFGSGAPLFEPIHGSAPTLAGTDSAQPPRSNFVANIMLPAALGFNFQTHTGRQTGGGVPGGGCPPPAHDGPAPQNPWTLACL